MQTMLEYPQAVITLACALAAGGAWFGIMVAGEWYARREKRRADRRAIQAAVERYEKSLKRAWVDGK